MTNKEAAERYQRLATELSDLYGKVEDLYRTAEFLSDRTGDCGDPEDALKEALWWLGNAISDASSYAAEYREDADKGIEEANPDGASAS